MNSIFNVLGPVMIGPSSSHTAGAGNIGRVAYMLTGGKIKSVKFTLHGSFAKTGKGHGTDKALIAGILGMYPYDERIKEAYSIAEKSGIEITFETEEFVNAHPNTVKIEIITEEGASFELMAASVGGGNISILSVNKVKAEFGGKFPTLIVEHYDRVGMISRITTTLANENVNIVALKLSRVTRGDRATAVVETDTELNQDIVSKIEEIDEVLSVVYMDRLN